MKNKIKYSYIIFLSLFLISSKPFTVQAKSLSKTPVNNIALNFAAKTMEWKNASISHVKNLYDFNNKLVAYDVDIKNNENNSNGYEIISANSKDNTILEFSEKNILLIVKLIIPINVYMVVF